MLVVPGSAALPGCMWEVGMCSLEPSPSPSLASRPVQLPVPPLASVTGKTSVSHVRTLARFLPNLFGALPAEPPF